MPKVDTYQVPYRSVQIREDRISRVLKGRKFDPVYMWLEAEMVKWLDPETSDWWKLHSPGTTLDDLISKGDFPAMAVEGFKTENEAKNFAYKVTIIQYDVLGWGKRQDKQGHRISPTKRKPYFNEETNEWALDIVRVSP